MSMAPFSLPGVLADKSARDALTWEPFREGIDISWVYRSDDAEGPSAAFLRYQPGASVPAHEHPGFEHILILEGSQADGNGLHGAGDLVINTPGSRHGVESPEGCVALAIWQMPVRFV